MKALQVLLFVLAVTISVSAQATDVSKLTGTIYDVNGSVVVGAKVTAVGIGKTFTAFSDGEGVFALTLPFNRYEPSNRNYKMSKYDITVQKSGFLPSETKNYIFIPSQFGKMYLDIALEIGSTDPGIEIKQ